MDPLNASDAEPLIRGEGTSEDDWRSWEGLTALEAFEAPAWLPAAARLVVVAPHPDDEILACGGLLSWHARRGGDRLVLAVTDGEASHGAPDQDSLHPAASEGAAAAPARTSLAAARRAESEAGLAQLGLRGDDVVRLAIPDGEVLGHRETLAGLLRSVLRPGDRVVTTWREDGHPDHEATAHATEDACRERQCLLLQAPVWMWHWAVPGDERIPWRRLRRFPLPPDVRASKVAALAAHRTQLSRRGPAEPAVLGQAIIERNARAHEYYFH